MSERQIDAEGPTADESSLREKFGLEQQMSGDPKARHYQAKKLKMFFIQLFFQAILLFALVASGASLFIKNQIYNYTQNSFFVVALYITLFNFIFIFFGLPFDFYEGFILERQFGLSRQSFRSWLKENLKKSFITFLVSLAAIEAIYYFLARFQSTWWFWAALFWFLLSVVMAKITPQVIIPLFYKYKALGEGELRVKIFELFEKYGIELKEVFVLDFSRKTVKANAMVAGLGSTKRIFLSDTLVSDFSTGEILAVLAHEAGHFVRRDTMKLVFVSFFSALLSFFFASFVLESLFFVFGFSSVDDIAGLPLFLIVMMAAGLFLLPMQNGFSRFLESGADRFAIKATRDRESFIAMMAKLGRKNFADFSPNTAVELFFYSHPPISKRIRMARIIQY